MAKQSERKGCDRWGALWVQWAGTASQMCQERTFNPGRERVHEDAWEKNIVETGNADEAGGGERRGGGVQSVSQGPEVWEARGCLGGHGRVSGCLRGVFWP